MPSAQDCAERLREQAYRTLLPQIRDLDKELQSVSDTLSTGIQRLGQKLNELSHIELPTTEVVLNEILGDITRETDLNASALALFAQNVRQKETQEEILACLLDAVQRYVPVAGLFAVRGSRYIGWSSRGYSELLTQSFGACDFPRSDCPKFDEVLEGAAAVTCSDLTNVCVPLQFLQDETRGDFRLIPLQVLDRPVGILIAGGGTLTQNSADAVAVLAEFAVLRLENISLRILYELSAIKRESSVAVQEKPAPAEIPASAAPVVEEIPPEPIPEEPAAQPEHTFSLEAFQTVAHSTEAAVSTLEEISFTPPVEQAEPEQPVLEPAPPKVQVQEIRPLPEEEKLHSEAKRFARLLVSEIKLYNEKHVVEGRENRDLYLRLKRDIDRSRDMYEKRVPPTVSRKIDYFHDEIIRILGDNDPSTLGSDYPGPRVES
jgi:hypothetical protein